MQRTLFVDNVPERERGGKNNEAIEREFEWVKMTKAFVLQDRFMPKPISVRAGQVEFLGKRESKNQR